MVLHQCSLGICPSSRGPRKETCCRKHAEKRGLRRLVVHQAALP